MTRTRSRYFKNSGKSKPSFQWTGSPATSPSRLSNFLYYSSFTVGDLSASVGDHVLIRGESMNQDILDCDVARLDRLYEDFDKKNDPYRAVVTWLCRPDFLPHSMDCSHGMEEEGALPFNNKHEVVGEAREFEKDISAESIYFKCTVVAGGVIEDPVQFTPLNKKGPYPCYLHRFNMVMVKKNKFSVEPVLSVAKKSITKRRVLRSRSASPVSPRLTVTPIRVNVAEMRLSKRRMSLASGKGSERKKTRASSSKETSPELNSFVVGTPTALVGTPDGRSRRTPKPRQSMDYNSLVGVNERARTRHKSTPGRVGSVITTERFTQVETATGSGRKLTIKCGDMCGLAGKQISTLLDSDDPEENMDKNKKKVSTQMKRTRRASVSCTTPTRLTISTVTPKKTNPRRRPASEMKQSGRSKSNYSSEDDFQPTKSKPKKAAVSKLASKNWSSSTSSDSDS